MQEVWGSSPHQSTEGDVMVAKQVEKIKTIQLDKEGEKQMEGIRKRHPSITDAEADKLRNLSKKYLVQPERVAATIALNQFTKEGMDYWTSIYKETKGETLARVIAIGNDITFKTYNSSKGGEIRDIKPEYKSLVEKLRDKKTISYYSDNYEKN